MKKMILVALMSLAVSAMSAQVEEATDQLRRSMSGLFDKEAEALRPDSVTPDGEWQKVVETTLTAQEAYKAARQVLARMVPKYQQRVQLEDAQDCKIICDMALELLGSYKVMGETGLISGIYQMTMTFAFKDGRFRVKADGVTCDYVMKYMGDTIGRERGEAFRTTNGKTKDKSRSDMQLKAGLFVKAFKTALEKQKADDDF